MVEITKQYDQMQKLPVQTEGEVGHCRDQLEEAKNNLELANDLNDKKRLDTG